MRRITSFLFIFSCLLVFVVPVFADDCSDALNEAKNLYNAGNYSKAKSLFEYVTSECGANYGDAASWSRKCTEQLTPQLTVSRKNISVGASAGTTSVTVTSNREWKLQNTNSNMFSVSKNGNTVTIRYYANSASSSRSDYFDIVTTDDSKSVRVTINQAAYRPSSNSINNTYSATTGTHAGHEWVDLGLSVKWATCNVGASTPTGYGNYYAWGETTTKSTYNWRTYKWATVTYNAKYNRWDETLTKYNTSSSYSTIDNKTQLELADDAARANWGGAWRMPTKAEWAELREKCTGTWTTRNGVKGYEVKSKINGNSIFFPAAGYRYADDLSEAGDIGNYWSSSLYTDDPENASGMCFKSLCVYMCAYLRTCGWSVRPVLSDQAKEEQLRQEQLAQAQREAEERARQAEQERKAAAAKTGTHAGHEWVDLGLSIKWATCNVGASTPTGYGNYYAWGETTTKSTYKKWSTYKWCKSKRRSLSLTKYNTDSYYGTVDNKTVLDLEDDAARANWGGAWRMPTDAEWTELREKCTWTWTIRNGVKGYEVKSKINGNSIFLPSAGYRGYDDLYYAGSDGSYWSSSLYAVDPSRAWYVYFNSDNALRSYYYRYYGRSVRPVFK